MIVKVLDSRKFRFSKQDYRLASNLVSMLNVCCLRQVPKIKKLNGEKFLRRSSSWSGELECWGLWWQNQCGKGSC